MRPVGWLAAAKESADPRRARQGFEALAAGPSGGRLGMLDRHQLDVVATLFAGSQALGEWLLARPDWLDDLVDLEGMRHPRRSQGLRRDIDAWLRPLLSARDYAGAMNRLREFRRRQMLRVAVRDLTRQGTTAEILREISDVADVVLAAAHQVLQTQFRERFGDPWHQDPAGAWHPTEFCVFGMGKLGGQELNYSSDIDLIFVYTEEGVVHQGQPLPGAELRGLSSHQFFQRFIEAFVAELTRMTNQGALFRVDLRLRPEGDAGPLARSLASYENYYAQWGQTWERMMLIKARCVAGDAALAAEFLETVQPFRYPRSLPAGVLQEIGAMKQRTEREVVRSGEIDRNVKLGRGGIREIEFIAQAHQLLHGGRLPFLQGAQTLPTLDKMVQYNLLSGADARALAAAYGFLRDVEHRLQMENNLQTHTIPQEKAAHDRLARLMGFKSVKAFEAARQAHCARVRTLYEAFIQVDAAPPNVPLPTGFVGHETAWKGMLEEHAFRQVDKSYAVLRTFVEGPGYVHVSPRTVDLARQLTLRLLRLCPRRESPNQVHWPERPLSDPDRVLARLDTYVTTYGSRAMLYETWTSNPSIFELLLLLFDRSEFLAETAIRTPDLVEDLVLSGQLRRRKASDQILQELRHGSGDEDQRLWLRRYHQSEFMRLGLRDILGLADFEQSMAELSGLAEACLQYALEATMRRHRLRRAPFAIIGLGKLGGAELIYGSDLDVTFVADARTRNLPALQRVAAEVMEMLSGPTELGVAFQTDARLRPDGAKGLLVNTLPAYEQYYRKRAQLWEIQALSRARPIAGDPTVGSRFAEVAGQLTDFSRAHPAVAAYHPEWMRDIARMRARIEKERTPAGKAALAIKTGAGGLIDAEFVAQAFCLAHGWAEPNTRKALSRAREAGVLDAKDAAGLLEHYCQLQRIEGILRRWSFVGEAELPDDPAPLYRVAVRCGFRDADTLLANVAEHRRAVRQVYAKVFPPA